MCFAFLVARVVLHPTNKHSVQERIVSHLIHIADLPQNVAEAVVADIHNDDRLSFGAADAGLRIEE